MSDNSEKTPIHKLWIGADFTIDGDPRTYCFVKCDEKNRECVGVAIEKDVPITASNKTVSLNYYSEVRYRPRGI